MAVGEDRDVVRGVRDAQTHGARRRGVVDAADETPERLRIERRDVPVEDDDAERVLEAVVVLHGPRLVARAVRDAVGRAEG